MRPGLLILGAVVIGLAGCTSSASTQMTNTTASSDIPSGFVKPLNLNDEEIAILRRDVAAAFKDPSRPLFDTLAASTDEAGKRYACGTVFGKAEAGGNPSPLPYAGMFSGKTFQILSKGGTTSESWRTEDLCASLNIRPRRR
jgi:hypothetical protein